VLATRLWNTSLLRCHRTTRASWPPESAAELPRPGRDGHRDAEARACAVTLTVDPAQRQTAQVYDADGEMVQQVQAYASPVPETTLTSFDAVGAVSQVTAAYGTSVAATTRYAHDAEGNVTLTIDPMNRQTAQLYGGDNQLTQTIDGYQLPPALWHTTEHVYDDFGDDTATTDPRGLVTDTSYNTDSESLTVTVGAELPVTQQETTHSQYDAFGRDVVETDPTGLQMTKTYNKDDATLTVTVGSELPASQWQQTSTFLDDFGNITETVDRLKHQTTSTFDKANEPLTVTVGADLPTSQQEPTTTQRDDFGNGTVTLDPLQHKTADDYNLDNEAVTVTAGVELPADHQEKQQQYKDADGNVTLTVDPTGRQTLDIYDSMNRVVEEITGYGSNIPEAEVRQYNADGQLTSETKAYGTPDAATTSYQYDAFGNVTLTTDPMGRETATTYDANNESVTVTVGYELPPAQQEVTTTLHDLFGNATLTVDPMGRATATLFDQDNRLLETIVGVQLAPSQWRITTEVRDAFGRVTLSTDPLGHETATTYDQKDEPLTVTVGAELPAAQQESTTSQYDAFGNVVLTTDAMGRQTATTFDQDNQPIVTIQGAQLDPSLWRLTQKSFDDFGDVTLMVDPAGHQEEASFNQDNESSGDIGGYGSSHPEPSLEYHDAQGNLTLVTDAAGNQDLKVYDNLNRLIEDIKGYGTPAAEATETLYNRDGEVTATIAGYGTSAAALQQTVHDDFGNVTLSVDPDGHQTQTAYNLDNEEVSSTVAAGTPAAATSTEQHDAFGELTLTVDGAGRQQATLFDANGQVTETIMGYGGPRPETHQTQYDAFGQVTLTTDSDGHQVETLYNADGEATLTVTGYASGVSSTTATERDPFGEATLTVDGDGREVERLYNPDGQATLTVTGYGSGSAEPDDSQYDADNNATVTVDGLGKQTLTTFDNLNRAVAVTDPDGHTTQSLYDAAGNLTGTIDGLGNLTQMAYDAQGRLVQTIDPRGAVTQRSYDAAGNLTALIDPDGNLTAWAYDGQNRQISMTDPLGNTAYTSYDADGHVTLTVDRDGRKDARTYDTDGLLTLEVWYNPDGSMQDTRTWTYDGNGQVLTASNSAGTYTYTYDADNRVSSIAEPFGLTLWFQYDHDGHVTLQTDSFGGLLTSVYNPDGLLATRAFSGPGQSPLREDFGYDADGRLTTETRYSDLAGMIVVGVTTQTYDDAGLLTGIVHRGTGGAVLASYNYAYDANNRLTSETDNGTTTTYGYDQSNELTTVNGQVQWSYDLAGNRTIAGYVTGPGNQLLSDGTWDYGYDAEGNQTSQVRRSDGINWQYTYNDANQLIGAVERDSNGTVLTAVAYGYDVDNRQLTRQDGSGWVGYGYDPAGNMWADVSAGSTLLMRRVFGDGANQPLAREDASGTTAWYDVDHLGSLRLLTDGSGAMLDRKSYDAFGQLLNESNPTAGDRLGFTGQQQDPVTRKYNYGRRMDQVDTGRFMTEDPLGFRAGDANEYRYAGNAPTDATDPSGELVVVSKNSTFLQQNLQESGVSFATVNLPGNRQYVDILSPDAEERLVAAKGKGISKDWIHRVVSASRFDNEDISIDGYDAGLHTTKLSPGEWDIIQRYDALATLSRLTWLMAQWKGYYAGRLDTAGDEAGRQAVRDEFFAGVMMGPGHAELRIGRTGDQRVDPSRAEGPSMVAAPAGRVPSQPGGVEKIDQSIAASDLEVPQAMGAAPGMVALMQYSTVYKGLEKLGPQRLLGMVQLAGGVMQMFAGLEAGPAAPFVLFLATDNMQAGVRALISGESTYTITNSALFTGLRKLGFEPEQADKLAGNLEIVVNLAGDWAAARGIGKARGALALEEAAPRAGQEDLSAAGEILKKNGYPGCFPAGTLVATADGLKPIESVRALEKVWAYDLVAGEWKPCYVAETFSRRYEGGLVTVSVAGEEIQATSGHPVWVVQGQELAARPRGEHLPQVERAWRMSGRWVDACDLQVGDVLLQRDGRRLTVTRIEIRHARLTVFNLRVEELQCYAVGEKQVLVHNNSAAQSPGPMGSSPTSIWEYRSQMKEVGSFDYSAPVKPIGNDKDVVVYWVINNKTRQVFKVGDTTVESAIGNWQGNTLKYAKKYGVPRDDLSVEYLVLDKSVTRRAPYDPETLLRKEFENQGHKLPWDRERGRNPDNFVEAP
jgi:RHS repeat-associated protein